MINIKSFKLICVSKDIDKDFYKKFIIKLLNMKLDYIELKIYLKFKYESNEEYYSYYELKEINPKLKCYDLNKIKIKKFK